MPLVIYHLAGIVMVDKLQEDPQPPSLRIHLHDSITDSICNCTLEQKSSLHVVKDLSFIIMKKIEKKHLSSF